MKTYKVYAFKKISPFFRKNSNYCCRIKIVSTWKSVFQYYSKVVLKYMVYEIEKQLCIV